MPEVTFNVPLRAVVAVCRQTGFRDMNGDNLDDETGLSLSQWFHQRTIEYWRSLVITLEGCEAAEAARQARIDEINTNVKIT